MTPKVLTAQWLNGYRIELLFSNNERRVIDIKPYLSFGVFSKLKDINLFKQIKVAFGTIEWPGGLDLDPEFVWEKSTPANK